MRTLILATLVMFGSLASAKSFKVEAQFDVSGDSMSEIDKKEARADGWVISGLVDEEIYQLNDVVDETKLPYTKQLGDAWIKISKSGVIEMGMSIGDADAGAESSVQWPSKGKKFLSIGQPLVLTVVGGEHASAAWAIDAKASIKYE